MKTNFKEMLQEANRNSLYSNIGQLVGAYIIQAMMSEEDEMLKDNFLFFFEDKEITFEMTLEEALKKLYCSKQFEDYGKTP